MKNLTTRDDTARLLLEILRPLKGAYSRGKAWMLPGNTGAHYGRKSAAMEGFARVLWGLGPLFGGKSFQLTEEELQEIEDWKQWSLEGILHGTDPEHEEYWGDLIDFDQKMVEMAALTTALLLAKDSLWEPLKDEEKTQVFQWLDQINHRNIHKNNWIFFRILVNMLFICLELPVDKNQLEEDFSVVESCYEDDGWYHDGNTGQLDYYIPFAFHYYGLIYAHFMKDKDPDRAKAFVKRAETFMKDFIYWFAEDGNEIPYGRSLTYRFAHGAFFAAAAFAQIDEDYGVMKRLLLGNLRRWMERPIFDEAGVLSIGYGYPNLFMCERYNAPGSPYWGLKTFLVLTLPEDHPFWTAEEKAPEFESQKMLSHPHMIVTHGENGHVLAYPTSQHCMEHGNISAKYEKFVYSNLFGFSVSRGNMLETGAFDNTLAVSETGEEVFRMRWGVEDFEVTEDYLRMKYCPMKGVQIQSTIIPFGPWHVRIHEIETEREITLADGGFAVGAEAGFDIAQGAGNGKYTQDMVKEDENSMLAAFPWGYSGAVSFTQDSLKLVNAFPNTNMFWNLTVIPTVMAEAKPGKCMMATAFYGASAGEAAGKSWEKPVVTVTEQEIIAKCSGKEIRVKRFADR